MLGLDLAIPHDAIFHRRPKLLRIYCECCAFLLSSKRDKSIFERLFISSLCLMANSIQYTCTI
jgi:hypothetical protein